MKNLKALVTAAFTQESLEELKRINIEVEYHNWLEQGRPNATDEINKMVKGKDILIVETDEVPREIIEANTDLKVVCVCRGLRGDDPTVDIKACSERNIPILFTPGRNINSTAEHALMATLCAMKRVHLATQWLYGNKWVNWLDIYVNFRTTELSGKTVGIIGFGNIGKRVAELFSGFGTRLLVFDPYVNDLAVFRSYNAEKVDLKTLLKTSDVVTMHMNVSDETKSMIGEEEIALMKPTAFLINCARATCIDHDALYNALVNKKIAGAATDVFHKEPTNPASEPLLTLDNLFATPHLAGTTMTVIENHSRMVVNDLKKLLNGEAPVYMLNPEVLPLFTV